MDAGLGEYIPRSDGIPRWNGDAECGKVLDAGWVGGTCRSSAEGTIMQVLIVNGEDDGSVTNKQHTHKYSHHSTIHGAIRRI